jgi:hypothetical protein
LLDFANLGVRLNRGRNTHRAYGWALTRLGLSGTGCGNASGGQKRNEGRVNIHVSLIEGRKVEATSRPISKNRKN